MQDYIRKVDIEIKQFNNKSSEVNNKKQLEKEMNELMINELDVISEQTDLDKIEQLHELESKNSRKTSSISRSPSAVKKISFKSSNFSSKSS